MVKPREEAAHKLLGTPGSNASLANIRQEFDRSVDPLAIGQYDSRCLHEQLRRDGVNGLNLLNKKPMDVVLGTQHTIRGPTSSWVLKQDIADESCTLRDCSDWMLNQQVFYKINQVFGPLEVDLFASRLTTQLPVFYSWRPDPSAKATDALVQENDEGVCQPTVGPISGQDSGQTPSSESSK